MLKRKTRKRMTNKKMERPVPRDLGQIQNRLVTTSQIFDGGRD
jgi:hypothetical protein